MDLGAARVAAEVEGPRDEHAVAEVAVVLDVEVQHLPDVGVAEVAREPVRPAVHGGRAARARPRDPLEVVRTQLDQARDVPAVEASDHFPRERNALVRHRPLSIPHAMMRGMKSNTVYMTFNTERRREFVRITEDVQAAVDEAGIAEGFALVSAMHITAGVWVNDDEPGLQEDVLEWPDKVAPPSWKPPANDVARELSPDPGDYRHHAGGEDNGDAHLKNLLVHHQVILPVTEGRLDLGPWQQVFYTEFDGGRSKRLVIKVIGE